MAVDLGKQWVPTDQPRGFLHASDYGAAAGLVSKVDIPFYVRTALCSRTEPRYCTTAQHGATRSTTLARSCFLGFTARILICGGELSTTGVGEEHDEAFH